MLKIREIRESKNLTQDELVALTGISKRSYVSYENEKSDIPLSKLQNIATSLNVSISELIGETKNKENATILNGGENGGIKKVKQKVKKTPPNKTHQEIEPFSTDGLINVPLIDIEAAAGMGGVFNPNYIEVLGHISVPDNMLQKNGGLYYAIKTRGQSMTPTIFDKDVLIIRYLEIQEWEDLRDEYVYVVVSKDGDSYVKRVKNRMNKGFIVLMSDNLDKSVHPNFILENEEINNLFFVEMKMSPFLPNINTTYYDRVKQLEDRLDGIENKLTKINK